MSILGVSILMASSSACVSAMKGNGAESSGGVRGDVPVDAVSTEEEEVARCRRMASSSAPSEVRLSAAMVGLCGQWTAA